MKTKLYWLVYDLSEGAFIAVCVAAVLIAAGGYGGAL